MRTAILSERIGLLDFLQRFFKFLPDSEQWILVPEVAEGLMLPTDSWAGRAMILMHGYQPTMDKVKRYFDRLDAWYRTPDDKVQPADLREEFLRNEQNILVVTLLASLERPRQLRMQTEVTRRALHLTAALLARDSLPESLEELDGPSLGKVRIDPISGEPFRFERTARHPSQSLGEEEDRQDLQRFTLYAVGLDRKDQGGKHEPDSLNTWDAWDELGDYVFWPRP